MRRLAQFLLSICIGMYSDLFGQLNGSYTIGGTSPDYISIESAITDLVDLGIDGAVVFNIRDGLYNEQITIPTIVGSSATNTITFQSENLDQNAVVWEYDAELGGSTPTSLTLFGGGNLIFRHLTFVVSYEPYEYILVSQGADNVLIEYCKFEGSPDYCASDMELRVSLYANPGGSNNWVVRNNFFTGNCSAIDMAFNDNWLIEENTFDQEGNFAMFVGYSNNVTIRNNIAISHSPLYFSENTDFEVTGNDWMGSIVFDGETGTPANPGLFANNFVRAGFCLELYYAFNLQVYNNSLRGSSAAIYSSNLNLPDLKNNILYGQSYCFRGNDSFTSSLSDNNCLYSGSGNIASVGGTLYETLEDWQTYTGSESNSFVADPMFISDQDLHVCNELLDGVALDLDGIDVDFDGEPRPDGNLDIGADEFDLQTCGCTLSGSIELISDYNG